MSKEIPEIVAELEEIAVRAKATFGHLNDEQINWKANPETWSIGQCFEHLIVTNKMEMIAIEKALDGEHTKTFWERLPVLPTVFGKLLIRMVDPQSQRKFKAPKNFRPVKSSVSPQIVGEYIENSEKVMKLMKAGVELDMRKMIITSPVPRVAYSLYDACLVIGLHDRRHFNQAERVLQTEGFPSGS